MGVLNVTPDSFSDGGRYAAVDDAVAHALAMRAEGAKVAPASSMTSAVSMTTLYWRHCTRVTIL